MTKACHCRSSQQTEMSNTTRLDLDIIAGLLSRASLVFPSSSGTSFKLGRKSQVINRMNVVTLEHHSHMLYCCELQQDSEEVLVLGEWANTEAGAEKSVENILDALKVEYHGAFPVKAVDVQAYWTDCSVCGNSRQAF